MGRRIPLKEEHSRCGWLPDQQEEDHEGACSSIGSVEIKSVSLASGCIGDDCNETEEVFVRSFRPTPNVPWNTRLIVHFSMNPDSLWKRRTFEVPCAKEQKGHSQHARSMQSPTHQEPPSHDGSSKRERIFIAAAPIRRKSSRFDDNSSKRRRQRHFNTTTSTSSKSRPPTRRPAQFQYPLPPTTAPFPRLRSSAATSQNLDDSNKSLTRRRTLLTNNIISKRQREAGTGNIAIQKMAIVDQIAIIHTPSGSPECTPCAVVTPTSSCEDEHFSEISAC